MITFTRCVAFAALMFALTINSASAQTVVVNEVMASNSSSFVDEDGDASDWIELHNAGAVPIGLDGYGLSDNAGNPFKWVLPDVTIQPGGFLLVWASNKNRRVPGQALHTNYAVSAGGEDIVITSPDGSRIDMLPAVPIPTNVSIGRKPDGTGDWVFFLEPTPGSANITDSFTNERLEPVSFSVPGGFHTAGFSLNLSHPNPDAIIVYTLDGSEPDADNVNGTTFQYKNRYRETSAQSTGPLLQATYRSHTYQAPIPVANRSAQANVVSAKSSTYHFSPAYFPGHTVSKATVVRARAVKPGAQPSPVSTQTYFVNPSGRAWYPLTVVAIGIPEPHLFDYERGIYTAGVDFDNWRAANPFATADGGSDANYGRREGESQYPAELPGNVELFEPESATAQINQGVGIRIHGGFSRSWPMKTLRLYARREFGPDLFHHAVFPDRTDNAYRRLLLRNSGNDWGYTLFRDAAIHEIMAPMGLEDMAYRPAILFLNGEYWGIHNLRERQDPHYLARRFNLDPDRVDILENNMEVSDGSATHYQETIAYLTANSMADPVHYAHIRTRIDVENFIDYQIAQIFAGNHDWPGNNLRNWRFQADAYAPDAPPGQDGRWRWMLFDTDFGFNLYGNRPPETNSILHATAANGPAWPNPPWSTLLLRRLLLNPDFSRDFVNRFADHLNTTFRNDRMQGIISDMADGIRPTVAEHALRWKQPTNLAQWEGRVNAMSTYAAQRPAHVYGHIQGYFGFRGRTTLTVNVSNPAAGYVQVNSIPIRASTPGVPQTPYPWAGSYFVDHPVTLRAVAWPGYAFSHWEGLLADHNRPEVTFNQRSGGVSVRAVFVPHDDPGVLPQAHRLGDGAYLFDSWPADSPAGTYPDHMAFVFMDRPDPGLDAAVSGFTSGAYDLASRSRINGLGADGFAFINTGNEDGNAGYPGMRLGGALLAISTEGRKEIDVTWEGVTVLPNSRVYHLRLQYRIGNDGPFLDIRHPDGTPVEYRRHPTPGHRQVVGPVRLPQEADNTAYVQLLWRYYFTGEQTDPGSGQRSQMAVSSIRVEAKGTVVGIDAPTGSDSPEAFLLHPNHPNPFNPTTEIRYTVGEAHQGSRVKVAVYDILGREVAVLADGHVLSGTHHVRFDASSLASGVYIAVMSGNGLRDSLRMLLVK